MKFIRAGLGAVLAAVLAACGSPAPSPLQSPVQPSPQPTLAVNQQPTPAAGFATAAPTVTQVPSPTPAANVTVVAVAPVAPTAPAQFPTVQATATNTPLPALVPTVVRTPFTLPTPIGGVPDTKATSRAVILTITALAIPPTMPPTATPQKAIGAGGRGRVTAIPTPTLDPSGISILSVSETAYRGSAGSLTIRTKPNAQCTVTIARDGASPKPLPDGASRAAGKDGVVAWIWTVGADEPAGARILVIDCGDAGEAQVRIAVD